MKCFPIDIIMLSLAITSNACMQIRMILVVTIFDVSSFWQSHSFIHSSSDYCHICIDMHMNAFKWKSFCFTLNNEYCCARTHTHTHKLASFLVGSFFYLFNNPICLASLSYLPLKQLETAWMQNLLSNIADDLNGLRMLRMTWIKYCSFWHVTQLWNQIKWSTLPSRVPRTNFQNSSSYISYGCYSSGFQCSSIIFPLIC